MSLANDSLLFALAQQGYQNQEAQAPNTTQATATRITGQVCRITGSAGANGAVVLPSLLSNEADSALGWVLNDSPNSIKLFPSGGESQNGVANASLTIAAGAAAFYYKEPSTTGKGGGQTGTNNWHSSSVS